MTKTADVTERVVVARTSDRSGTVGIIVMVVGAIFAVAGVVTYFVVSNELANEKVTVSDDAKYFAGQDVTGPFTAYSEAETINKHALEATGGKTYAELDREDPLRETAMQASFLRASLFTSVVAFGVAALAAVLGIILVLIGWELRSLGRQARVAAVDPVSAAA
jgi:hypothetical protein